MGYAFIPEELLSDQRVNAHHIAVWAALDSFCTKDSRECYPSQPLLIQRSKCSEATFRRRLRELEKWGYVETAQYTNGNLKSRNRYRLLRSVRETGRQTHDATDQPVSVSGRSGQRDRNNRSERPEQSVTETVSTKKAPKKVSQGRQDKAVAAWAAWNKHLGCDPRTKQHRTNSQGLPASKDLRKVLFAFVGDDPNRDFNEYFSYLADANPWAWFDGSFSVNIVWATRPATRTKVAAEGYGDRKSSDASAAAALLASFGIPALPEG